MNSTIRRIAKTALAWGDLSLIHQSKGHVAELLLAAYQNIRFRPDDLTLLNRAHSNAYLQQLIKRHAIDFVADVGANTGQFASAIRTLNYEGDIVSFEPNPECQRILAERMTGDNHWRLRTEAVGARADTATLHIFRDSSFSSLYNINATGIELFGELVREATAYTVSLVTLDTALSELLSCESPRSILLKTDTQGNDLEVIRGATRLLERVNVVVTESSEVAIYDGTPNFLEIWHTLRKAGFVLAGMTPIGNRSDDLSLVEFDSFFVRPTIGT